MTNEISKFIKQILSLTLLVLFFFSPVLYFNIVLDPYGIFRKDFSLQRIEPNGHFIKMKHLLNNPQKYDSFIFGNSRANNIDCDRIPEGKWYNMYYSLGIPREHLRDLEILIDHGFKINNVLLCIDMSSYLVNYDNREQDLLRRAYRDDLLERFKYYVEYIFKIPQWEFVKVLLDTPPNGVYIDILESGLVRDSALEKEIINDPVVHSQNPRFATPIILGYQNNTVTMLADMEELLSFCKEHAISTKVLINPIYTSTMLANNPDLYFDLLKRLSQITNYYDFSKISSITDNSYFFYEPAHYRPLLGNAMMDFIYSDKRIDSIPDFGIYITPQNVDNYLDDFRKESVIWTESKSKK